MSMPVGYTRLPGNRANWLGYTVLSNSWSCLGGPVPQPWFPGGWPPGVPYPPGPPGLPPPTVPDAEGQGYGVDWQEAESQGYGVDWQEAEPQPYRVDWQEGPQRPGGARGPRGPRRPGGARGPTPDRPRPGLPTPGRNPNPPSWRYATNPDGSSLSLHVANYPTPGMFFDANNPQGRFRFTDVDSFLKAALGSAMAAAGMTSSIAATKNAEPLRKALADLMTCGTYNDGMFGTTSVGFIGGRQFVGPHGRGINWEPHHADVHQLIASRKTPYRTTNIDGSRLPQFIEAQHRPVVYVPLLNLDALRRYEIVPASIDPPIKIDVSGVRFPGGVGCNVMGGRGTAKDWWGRSK